MGRLTKSSPCESCSTHSVAPAARAPSIAAFTSPTRRWRASCHCGLFSVHCLRLTTPEAPSMSTEITTRMWPAPSFDSLLYADGDRARRALAAAASARA
jgi:hypothetical protein